MKEKLFNLLDSRRTTTILSVIILLLINWVSYSFYVRFDLSRSGRLRLTSATKKILKNLPEKVTIEAFFSEDIPETNLAQVKQLRDFLSEYESASGGKARLMFLNPDKDEDAKDRANTLGITPIDMGMIGDKSTEIKKSYLSVALSYGDQKELLPSVLKSNSLEYEMTSRIYKMAYPGERKIGLLGGISEMKLQEEQNPFESLKFLNESLEALYGPIQEVNISAEDVPGDITTLIIPTPNALTDIQKFRIDQFIMRGGSVFLTLGGMTVNLQNRMASPVAQDIIDFFRHYGIDVSQNMVMEPKNYMPLRQRVNVMQIMEIPYPAWIVITDSNMSSDSLITKGMINLFMPWASAMKTSPENLKGIDPTGKNPVVTSLLVKSSPDAWAASNSVYIDPQFMLTQLESDNRPNTGQYNLAYSFKGSYKSYFSDHKLPSEAKNKFIAQSEKETTIVAVGSPSFLSDNSLQTSRMTNLNMALASFDVMNGLSELVGARKKNIAEPMITGSISKKTKTVLTWLNFLIPLLIITGYGLYNYYQRKLRSTLEYTSASGT